MTDVGSCATCGRHLDVPAPLGLCPDCLLELQLAPTGIASSAAAGGPPPQIGRYRILSTLGEGGMGVVYLAEQVEPVQRRVAVKVIKIGMDTQHVIARFEAERQTLALMDHPNIAVVFDAGATPDGRPYFAMEYVDGLPLTKFCDVHRLSTANRLKLFTEVCAAIQHAHQKGVVHRDIKPSNVLVEMLDGRPLPKVIDFGVAKATRKQLVEHTTFTELGHLIGTPEYMSPEQARLSDDDVDTRTDIYSLGVVLYELLVGGLPFDRVRLRRAGYAEIQRIIRDETPVKPSSRLSGLGKPAQDVAELRRTDARSLARELRGDLDWITLKALDKEPARRYASASEFAADVQRHLSHVPVVARPPSALYQIGRFVRRHRVGVAAAAVAVAALVAGVTVSTLMYLQAERSRAEVAAQSYVAALSAAALALDFTNVPPSAVRSRTLAAVRHLRDAPANLRQWEWRVLAGRVDSTVAMFWAPPASRGPLSFSPDGRRVLWRTDRDLLAWDFSTAQRVKFISEEDPILAIDPRGRLLLRRHGADLRVQDATSNETTAQWPVADHAVVAADFSPDGTLLATGGIDGTIRYWRLPSGELRGSAIGVRGEPSLVQFSPDGSHLLVIAMRVPYLVTVGRPGAASPIACAHPVAGTAAATFTPDGQHIWLGDDGGNLKLCDPRTGQELWAVRAPGEGIRAVAVSQDGRWVATVGERMVHVWDANRRTNLAALPIESGEAVAFSPDARFVLAGGSDGMLAVWDLTRLRLTRAGLRVRPGSIGHTALSTDGQQIVSVSDDGFFTWDLGREPIVPARLASSLDPRSITAVAITDDGRGVAAGTEKGEVWRWSDLGAAARTILEPLPRRVAWLTFSRDGRQLAALPDRGHLYVFNLPTGRRRESPFLCLASQVAPRFTPTGQGLAANCYADDPKNHSGKVFQFWHLDSDQLESEPHAADVVALTPDGSHVVYGARIDERPFSDVRLQVREIRSRRLVLETRHPSSTNIWPAAASYSPGGERLAVGAGLLEASTGRLLLTLPGTTLRGSSMGFDKTGTRLTLGGYDGTIHMFEGSERMEAGLVVAEARAKMPIQIESAEEILSTVRSDRQLTPRVRDEAVQRLDAWVDQDPGHRLSAQAWAILKTPERPPADYRRALALVEASLKFFPWSPEYLGMLGMAQYRSGDHPRALETLKQSLDRWSVVGEAWSGAPPGGDRRGVSADVNVVRVFRAMSLLTLGRVGEAQPDLELVRPVVAQGLTPKNPIWKPRAAILDLEALLREAESLANRAGGKKAP